MDVAVAITGGLATVLAASAEVYEFVTRKHGIEVGIRTKLPKNSWESADKVVIIGSEGVGKSYISRMLVSNEEKYLFESKISVTGVTSHFTIGTYSDSKHVIIDTLGLNNTSDPLKSLAVLDKKDPSKVGFCLRLIVMVINPSRYKGNREQRNNVEDLYKKLNLVDYLDNVIVILSCQGHIDEKKGEEKRHFEKSLWDGVAECTPCLKKIRDQNVFVIDSTTNEINIDKFIRSANIIQLKYSKWCSIL